MAPPDLAPGVPLADGAGIVAEERAEVWIGPAGAGAPADQVDLRVRVGPAEPEGWIALPSGDVLRSGRRLRRFCEPWCQGGAGGRAVPWRAIDVSAAGSHLTLVVAAGGPWRPDLLHWLPKVLGDAPTVLVTADAAEAEALRAVAHRHSSSLVLVVVPGDAGALLGDGAFGELVLWPGAGARLAWTGDRLVVADAELPVSADWTPDRGWSFRGVLNADPP